MHRGRTATAWAALLALGALACAPGASPPALLHALPGGDVLDGRIADLALPSDATFQPAQARGWIAQGCMRAAIRLSDGARMDAENEVFDAAAGKPERLLALELDEGAQRLYTLSENALYREDLSSPYTPADPGNKVAFVLAPGAHSPLDPPLAADEQLLDVKLVPREPGSAAPQRVLLLTSQRLLVLASDAAGLAVQGQCLELFECLNGGANRFLVSSSDAHFNALQVDRFVAVRVALDHTGRTIAYLFANIGAYADDVHGSVPLLILCDLDAAADFVHPTLDADLPPETSFAYWSPFDADPSYHGSNPESIHANSARALALRVGSDATEVYVACGREKQLRCVTAEFEPGGIRARATITLDPGQDLELVHLAADEPQRLIVRGTYSLFDIDLAPDNPTWTRLDDTLFHGAVCDPAQVLMASGAGTLRTLWTMGTDGMRFNVQAFDIGLQGPSPVLGLACIWNSDGAVALDFENTYVLTGGGVRHYRWNGARWDQAGYRPTQDGSPGADPALGFSEQLDLGHLGPGNDHLLGPSNAGTECGLFDWPLDAAHDPQDGRFYPLPASEVFPGWQTGDTLYIDDVAFLAAGGRSYAALCPTRVPRAPGSVREAALVLYRWDSGSWTLCASAHTDLAAGYANTIALADLADGAKVAFVATDAGVDSFTLRELAGGAPTVELASAIPDAKAFGVAVAGSRLVAAYTHSEDPRYVIYDWDLASGAIQLPASHTIPRSELGLPGSYGRTYRLRYDPLSAGEGELYDCNDGGVFRLRYLAAGAGSLRCDAWWQSAEKGIIQDCRVYAFGGEKRLLVTKDVESFSWLGP